jgi:DNA-directed RNA polymerase subunit H (RpoH/RPB5)
MASSSPAAAAPAGPASHPEDVGYETARIRGVDVLWQVAIMLRQRGCRVCTVAGLDVRSDPEACVGPLAGVPDEATCTEAEAWMQRVLTRPGARIASTAPWHPVLVAEVCGSAPEGTAARVHQQRSLEAAGDRTCVYLIPADKVRVKQLRAVQESLARQRDPPPKRVIIASREKIAPAALLTLRAEGSEGIISERFLLRELSYNPTRHFLVPPHRVCSPDEVATLRRRFPKLALQSRDDMISRFHGLLPGDVVIYRRQRLGSYGGDYYREVV